MKKYSILSIVLVFALMFTSCDDVTNSSLNENSELNQVTKVKGPADKNPVSSSSSILEIAASNDDFSILAQAVVFADLDEALNAKRQLTVFAPTNEAFVALLDALDLTAEELFAEENKELVRNILLYHVASGKRQAKSVVNANRINTLLEQFANIKRENGSLLIGNEENGFATITATDIFASNGVIHIIDGVLLPPAP